MLKKSSFLDILQVFWYGSVFLVIYRRDLKTYDEQSHWVIQAEGNFCHLMTIVYYVGKICSHFAALSVQRNVFLVRTSAVNHVVRYWYWRVQRLQNTLLFAIYIYLYFISNKVIFRYVKVVFPLKRRYLQGHET